METPYIYNIFKDFPNQSVNLDTLTVEIQTSAITTTLSYITIVGDDVRIVFVDSLSIDGKNTLDGIVAKVLGAGNMVYIRRARVALAPTQEG